MSGLRGVVGVAALLVAGAGPGLAAAELVASEDGQTVYDTVADVTWLADANLAGSNTFGVHGVHANGSMTFPIAQAWIAAMNASNYLGSSKWGLPTTTMPDPHCTQNPKSGAFGYDCVGSQMGDLYYNGLGGVEASTIEQRHGDAYHLFRNFQPYLYWSATPWDRVPNSAFSFSFGNGFQGTNVFANAMYALPVAPGKVGFHSDRR